MGELVRSTHAPTLCRRGRLLRIRWKWIGVWPGNLGIGLNFSRLVDSNQGEPQNHLIHEPWLGASEGRSHLLLYFRLPRVFLGELRLLALHRLDETIVAVRLDDLIELRPVIRHETDALDVDVVNHPPVAMPEEPVGDRYLGAVLGDDLGAHGGKVAIHALAAVDDLLAAVQLDLGDVGALEEVAEEPHEIRALSLPQRQPVAAKRPPRNLGEIEDLVGDLADCRSSLDDLLIALQRGVVDRREHAVDGAPNLIGGGGRPRVLGEGSESQGREREPQCPATHQSTPCHAMPNSASGAERATRTPTVDTVPDCCASATSGAARMPRAAPETNVRRFMYAPPRSTSPAIFV